MIFFVAGAAVAGDTISLEKPGRARLAAGIGLLAVEYIGGPFLAQQVWWQNGFNWDNPLKYIGEGEPYLEDDGWHLASCAMFTEFHYQVLTRCFRAKHPELLAGALTFITWTGIESLDALDSKGKWMFSVNDEIANCLGIGFWTFKHYYPGVPVYVRVGMRKWGELFDYAGNAFVAIDDYEQYAANHSDNYATLKVETIYKVYGEAYAGIAVSKKDGSAENLWGVCAGYDFINELNGRKKGWWNEPLSYISRYSAVTLGFTYWFDR